MRTDPEFDKVRLRNGSESTRALVASQMMLFQQLLKQEPILFCEMLLKCRDDNHKMAGNAEVLLANGGFFGNYQCDFLLSAVRGDGIRMRLEDPILEHEAHSLKK